MYRVPVREKLNMPKTKTIAKTLLAVPAIPALAAGVMYAQVKRQAHRKDLPSHTNQDPTGTFGDSAKPKLRLVALGDSSITAPGVEPLDDCFVRRVALHLTDRYFVDLISVAVGGSKSRDVLAQQVEDALQHHPDLALVSVGANDALRGTLISRYESELDQIIGRLHSHAGAIVVMGVGDLGTLPRLPASVRGIATWRSRMFDDATARVVSQYSRIAKASNWGEEADPFATRDLALFASDQFHASGEGHRVFAARVIPATDRAVRFLDF